jgi:hypothetical protein
MWWRWLLKALRTPQGSSALAAVLLFLAVRHRIWLRAQAETWLLQAQALAAEGALDGGPLHWLQFQYHVWGLLRLDLVRRIEEARVGRYGLSAGVPHVDTGRRLPPPPSAAKGAVRRRQPRGRVGCTCLCFVPYTCSCCRSGLPRVSPTGGVRSPCECSRSV